MNFLNKMVNAVKSEVAKPEESPASKDAPAATEGTANSPSFLEKMAAELVAPAPAPTGVSAPAAPATPAKPLATAVDAVTYVPAEPAAGIPVNQIKSLCLVDFAIEKLQAVIKFEKQGGTTAKPQKKPEAEKPAEAGSMLDQVVNMGKSALASQSAPPPYDPQADVMFADALYKKACLISPKLPVVETTSVYSTFGNKHLGSAMGQADKLLSKEHVQMVEDMRQQSLTDGVQVMFNEYVAARVKLAAGPLA